MTLLEELSPIQRLAQSACYTEGWEFYQQLSMPSASDDRWAGICLWNLGRLEDARTIFTRAKRRGDTGALVGLASISRLLGLLDDCEAYLELAFDGSLSPDDWVRALRERGDLHMVRNHLKAALEAYSDARLEAELCKEAKVLIPMIDQSLGYTHHLLGNDRKAKELLDRAMLSTNPMFRLYVRATRILVHIYNGDIISAESEIFHQDFQNINSSLIQSLIFYGGGILKIIQKNWNEAHLLFNQSVEITEINGFIETEYLSKLGICKIYIGLGQLGEARAALKRAENLNVSAEYVAARDLTAGVLWTNLGQLEQAYEFLSQALKYYQTRELARELAWTHLHFAVWHLKNNDSESAANALEHVADIANALGGTAFLMLELRLISDIQALVAIATPYGLNALKPVLEANLETEDVQIPLEHRPVVNEFRIQAFGQPMLLANGKPVHLSSTAKTLEVLAYLMIHPMSTLEKILTDVFEESDPKAARNNFHQIKHQLVQHSNGLQIAYDRVTRTYSLEAKTASLTWDYSEIMRYLSVPVDNDLNQALDLYAGAFLRHSSAEWVEEVRSNVEWLMVRTGLKVVQDLFERGDFDACRKMTERLRKVEPLDEGLNELLVRATTELEGALAGRRTVAEVERTFGGYGEVLPPTLKRLREELKLTLN
jgi:DNA-binding SARP family transcriptional activator